MKTQKSNFKIVIAAAILAAASILSSCSKTTIEQSNPIKTFTVTDNSPQFGRCNTVPVTYESIYQPMLPKYLSSGNPNDAAVTVTVNNQPVPCTVNGISFSYKVDGSGGVEVFTDKLLDFTNNSGITIVVSLTTTKY